MLISWVYNFESPMRRFEGYDMGVFWPSLRGKYPTYFDMERKEPFLKKFAKFCYMGVFMLSFQNFVENASIISIYSFFKKPRKYVDMHLISKRMWVWKACDYSGNFCNLYVMVIIWRADLRTIKLYLILIMLVLGSFGN